MADDQLRSVDGADDGIDPADLAAVQAALADLSFLRPDAPADGPQTPPMPAEVWAGISQALAAERQATPEVAPGGSSRLLRWGGGLVAASVAVLAVGVGVTAMRGGGGSVVVAGDAPVSAAAFAEATGQPVDAMVAGAAPASPDADANAEALAGPAQLSFAGMVPPARMVVDSDMAYTRAGLEDQVSDVLDDYGVGSMRTAMKAAAPTTIVTEEMPMTGFTSSADLLRDCIDKLTRDAQATALLVDRATFEGQDAGIVVAPEEAPMPAEPSAASAASEAAPPASTPDPDVMVWVVDPDCDLKATIRIQLAP